MLRPNSLMETGLGLGEPEMDANSALTELDKGNVQKKNRILMIPFQ